MVTAEQSLLPASTAQRTAIGTAGHRDGDSQSDHGSVSRRRSVSPGFASTNFHNAFGETWSTAPRTRIPLDSCRRGLQFRKSPGNNRPAPQLRERAENGENRHSTRRRIPIRPPEARRPPENRCDYSPGSDGLRGRATWLWYERLRQALRGTSAR